MGRVGLYLLVVLLAACACKIRLDPSIPAAQAGALTLVHSPCENVPGRGLDICRFEEDSEITSVWRIIVPSEGRVKGGQVTVFFKDFSKSYPIQDNVALIPFKEIVGSEKWSLDDDGIARALAILLYKDDTGIEKTVTAIGEARIVVHKKGFVSMPIDSGFQAWEAKIKCRLQYSTSGRSAYKCEKD